MPAEKPERVAATGRVVVPPVEVHARRAVAMLPTCCECTVGHVRLRLTSTPLADGANPPSYACAGSVRSSNQRPGPASATEGGFPPECWACLPPWSPLGRGVGGWGGCFYYARRSCRSTMPYSRHVLQLQRRCTRDRNPPPASEPRHQLVGRWRNRAAGRRMPTRSRHTRGKDARRCYMGPPAGTCGLACVRACVCGGVRAPVCVPVRPPARPCPSVCVCACAHLRACVARVGGGCLVRHLIRRTPGYVDYGLGR